MTKLYDKRQFWLIAEMMRKCHFLLNQYFLAIPRTIQIVFKTTVEMVETEQVG